MRPVFSRFLGVQNGPLNYSGLLLYFIATICVVSRFRWIRARDAIVFNSQDSPEFWYTRYNMIFPASFLHNRLSAHYIEINHIFFIEMMKRYQRARAETLEEREACTEKERRTRYVMNPNYVYEPMGPDSPHMQRIKSDGSF